MFHAFFVQPMATLVSAPQSPLQRPPRRRGARRLWLRNALLSLIIVLVLATVGAAIALAAMVGQLPSIAVLDNPASIGFKTAQIFDRQGQLLWEINDPSGGRRTV